MDDALARIRAELDLAADLEDALARLESLELNAADLSRAMTEAMAMAHLAGEAALADEMDDEDPEAARRVREQ